jgi:cysteine desulfuration protein SufE
LDATELVERFQFFDDWQDRYKYLVDLGRELPPMEDSLKIEANRVRGCMSQVWLVVRADEATPPRLHVLADSDSAIVRGLIYVVQAVYTGRTATEIRAADIDAVFREIGLDTHLSPNRRNGFYAMVERIRAFAA